MNKIDKTDTLTKILSHRRFTVDVFQREYRWGRKQIEQMISDFQDTFEEFYDPDNHDSLLPSKAVFIIASMLLQYS